MSLPLPEIGESLAAFLDRFQSSRDVLQCHPLQSDQLCLAHGLYRLGRMRYAQDGGPCKPGQTVATTGCTPVRGEDKGKRTSGADREREAFFKAIRTARETLTGLARATYDRLPRPLQKVVDLGLALEHAAEGTYRRGQELAKAVASERGGSPEHVERVGRLLAYADGVGRWTGNIPVAHHLLHVVAHVGGPVSLLGSKAGWYVPAASLLYVAYSMGREIVQKRNPFVLIRKARERMKKAKELGHHD